MINHSKLRYVMDFSCMSDYTAHEILDAQKSFPSGHTSVSVLSSVFMAVSTLSNHNRAQSNQICSIRESNWTSLTLNLNLIVEAAFFFFSVVFGSCSGMVAFVLVDAFFATDVGCLRFLLRPDSYHRQTSSLVGRTGRCFPRTGSSLCFGTFSIYFSKMYFLFCFDWFIDLIGADTSTGPGFETEEELWWN